MLYQLFSRRIKRLQSPLLMLWVLLATLAPQSTFLHQMAVERAEQEVRSNLPDTLLGGVTMRFAMAAPRARGTALNDRPAPLDSSGFLYPDGVTNDPTLGRTVGNPGSMVIDWSWVAGATTYSVTSEATWNTHLATLAGTTANAAVIIENDIDLTPTKSIRRQTSGCKTIIIGRPAYERLVNGDTGEFIASGVRATESTPGLIWLTRALVSDANGNPLLDLGRQSGTQDKRGDGTHFMGVGFRCHASQLENSGYFMFLGATGGDGQNSTTKEPENIHFRQCVWDGGTCENKGAMLFCCRNSSIVDSTVRHWWANTLGTFNWSDVNGFLCFNSSGNILLENTYFDATGENVMFGGGAQSIGQDITNVVIRRCHLKKDRAYYATMVADEDDITTKNLWECKNVWKCVIEDCVMETSYDTDGGGQTGTAIVPKNNSYGSPGFDPRAGHILIRGCKISDFQILLGPLGFTANDDGTANSAMYLTQLHIIDNVAQDWVGTSFGSPRIFQISDKIGVFHFRHNTVTQSSSLTDGKVILFNSGMTTANGPDELVWEDNVCGWGEYGTNGGISRGGGPNGSSALTTCCVVSSVTRNLFMYGTAGTPAGYPAGNTYYAAWTDLFESADITAKTWRLKTSVAKTTDGWAYGVSDWDYFASRLVGVV